MSEAIEQLFPPIKPSTELEDLNDDALLEIFRRMRLYDLVRTEPVFSRWRGLQRQALREKTRLVLLDDYASTTFLRLDPKLSHYLKSPCNHLAGNAHNNSSSLGDDVLPISNMYHLVSFLYFLAPYMPNVKVLIININWATPEQICQLLLKFSKVECLILHGEETDNAAEWAPIQKVLNRQYTGLRHFVTNYHLAPERSYDPYIEYFRSQIFEWYCFLCEKVLQQWYVIRGLDLMYRGYTKVASLCRLPGTPSPAVEEIEEDDEVMETDDEADGETTDDETDDEMEEEDEEVEEIAEEDDLEEEAAAAFPDSSIFNRAPFKWIDRQMLIRLYLFIHSIAQPIFGLPPQPLLPFRGNVRQTHLDWKFLSQVEELHILGHVSIYNLNTYSFDSKLGSSGKMRKLTIGDVLLLNGIKEHLFQTLTYFYLTDYWIPHYAHFFRKLSLCQELVELHINFRKFAKEETTIDLLDYLLEGIHLTSGKGFPRLTTLGLYFPLASLSRNNFKKFTLVFTNISNLSLDLSRIKVARRGRLIKMAERGLPNLRYLTILNNGRGDFSWLECSRRISTFNLRPLQSLSIEQAFAFYRLALYRNDRANRGLDVQHRHITLLLSLTHYDKMKNWFNRKIEQHPEVVEATGYPDNLHVKKVMYN